MSHNERGAGNRPKIKRVGLRMTRQEKERISKMGFQESIEEMKEKRRRQSTSVKHYVFWIIITLVSGYVGHLIYGAEAYL